MGSIDYPLQPISVAIGAEATFVARTQDTNTKHLSEVLRRAAEHNGTAFVEVFQNCVVYHPTAWQHTTDTQVREDNIVFVEEGQPLVFGKDRDRGCAHERPESRGGDSGQRSEGKDLIVHTEAMENTSYAYMLSRMENPEFPLPFGVLRAVEKPAYTDLLTAQVETAIERNGEGDLNSLLHNADTWEEI